jgi:thiaminase
VTHIQNEMALHIEYCKGFGISKEEMEAADESEGEYGSSYYVWQLTTGCSACTAYTRLEAQNANLQNANIGRYVLDIGLSEDWLALQISMAPCLLGYGIIANRLHADPKTKREGNIYWTWIENYVSEDYTEAVKLGTGTETG